MSKFDEKLYSTVKMVSEIISLSDLSTINMKTNRRLDTNRFKWSI